ncbi:hypothetical protein [Azospirillum sp. sgz302134]
MKAYSELTPRERIRRQALSNARWYSDRGEPPSIVDDEIRRAFRVAPSRRRGLPEIEQQLTPEDLDILQAQQRRKPANGKLIYLINLNT